MLEIKDLCVNVDNKNVLKNLNLKIDNNEIHAVMGPNGMGKSTICKVIMGDPNYLVTKGDILFDGENIKSLDASIRAKKGIFYLNQNPIEIPGVTNAEMLRLALTEKNGTNVSIFEFNQKLETVCDKLQIPRDFIHRGINEGMSGGEKKKNELLHLWMLEPKFIILDELDSGLDVDALKIVCQNIIEYKNQNNASILIISHHAKLLEMLNCNKIHILSDGKIIKTSNLSLAKEIEKNGYKQYNMTNEVSENDKDE